MSSTKHIDFRELEQRIDQKLEQRNAYQPESRPLVQAALLNATFEEQALLGHLDQIGALRDKRDLQWLHENAVAAEGGRWTLPEGLRVHLLQKLQPGGQLKALHQRYRLPEDKRPLDRFYAALISEELSIEEIQKLSTPDIRILLRPLSWLNDAGLERPGRWYCEHRLEKAELLEQFRKHTEHFRGRKPELRKLNRFVFEPSETQGAFKSPLLIYGIGGIGKSSLISKFILEEFSTEARSLRPFVYLDFDRAGLSIAEPLQLAIEALRQLMLQFPAAPDQPDPLRDVREDLKSFVERDKVGEESGPTRKRATRSDTRGFILSSIAERHLGARKTDTAALEQPVTIVFDSFEEAQYRSSEAELRNLLSFLQEISDYLPNLRLIIVGRSDLVVAPFEFEKLEVEDFDRAAAMAYLEALGVTDEKVRDLIFRQVGGNPLILKLSATLGRKEIADMDALKQQLSNTQILELLVRRNIAHIPDANARKLVIPGMLVRRITAGLIHDVLAPASALGAVNRAESERLFQQLSRVTFLTEFREGNLYFRRDLRLALREPIRNKDPKLAEQLHRAALQYYEGKPGLSDQAEYLFHRLQVDDPAFLEQNDYDYARLRPFLESALSELPPSAASALGRMFDLRVEPARPDALNEEEWERNMDREIAKSLEDGVPESQLRELWERTKDKPGSFRGYQYRRAVVAVRLGLALEAPPAIYQLESKENPLDALYLLLQLGNYQNDPTVTQTAVKRLIALPDASGWLDFIPATLLIAKWAGLHNRSGTIAPAELLKALEPLIQIHTDLQQKLPKSDNLLLRIPLRYAALRRKLEWEPLAQLYTLAENAAQSSSDTYAFRQSFNQAFHAAVQDYARLREQRLYQQLVEHLLGLGLEKTNGQLYRAYQVLVSDLSEPGSWPTVVHDLADYLIARHGGKLEAAGKAFGITFTGAQEGAPAPDGRPRGFTPLEDPEPVQDLQALKADLRSKIANGKIEQALKALEGMGDEDFQNSIILLSGRFNRMQRDQRMGLTSDSATNIERNRIVQALLSYLEELG